MLVVVDLYLKALELALELAFGERAGEVEEVGRDQCDGLDLAEQLAQALREFEFAVRRELVGAEAPRFLGGSDEVPAEYRSLVEEYYRSLAEQRRRR